MIARLQVVQGLLDVYETPSYLEVGVSKGTTFNDVRAARKIAVDPRFLFDHDAVSRIDKTAEFHETTSDNYFGTILQSSDKFDVIYLDGLHTFEQTLRDLINSLRCLKEGGCIVVDDVVPNSYEASLPDSSQALATRNYLGNTDPSWMGDVYKLVFFVDTFFQQFSYATVSDNHGQLVMWPKARGFVEPRKIGYFHDADFYSIVGNRNTFRFEKYDAIRDKIIQDRRN